MIPAPYPRNNRIFIGLGPSDNTSPMHRNTSDNNVLNNTLSALRFMLLV